MSRPLVSRLSTVRRLSSVYPSLPVIIILPPDPPTCTVYPRSTVPFADMAKLDEPILRYDSIVPFLFEPDSTFHSVDLQVTRTVYSVLALAQTCRKIGNQRLYVKPKDYESSKYRKQINC